MIRAALAIVLLALVLPGAQPAGAYWTAGGTGVAFGISDTLARGSQPAATVSGAAVTISWPQTVFHGLPLGGYSNGGYTIRRYAAGAAAVAGGCAGTVSGGSTTLTCTEASVPPGSWQYTVTPVLGSWTGPESATSAAVSVAPDGPTLTSVTAQNPAAGQVTGAIAVSWRAVAGASGYNIYRRTASGSYDYTAPLNGSTPISTTSFSDGGSGLVTGTSYDYVVRAVSAGAESANSNELGATAIGRLAPPATATATAIAAGRIRVAWPSVTGASGYDVYRRTATGSYDFSSPLNGSTPVTSTSFADAATVDGTTYRYVIRSVVTGAGGAALESLTSSTESNAATADAVGPGGVTVSDPGSPLRGTITLAATAVDAGSGVASVRLQIAPAGSGAWTDACTATAGPYTCAFATASVADGLYDLRALATDAAGNSTASAIVAARRIDNTGPTVAVSDPGANLRGTITVSAVAADGGSGVASVTIQRAPTGTSTWTTICSDPTSPYSCSLDTTALADGGYDLRALATDAAGNQTTSALLANRIVDNTPPTGTNIQTANGTGTLAKPDAGDTISYTFSEAMRPASILAGWTGAATSVAVRFTNGNPDVITVWDAANTTQLALGSVRTGKKYVTNTVTFTGSTMVMSANTVVVTLGTPSGTTDVGKGKTALQWTFSTAATDLAGNPLAAGTLSEPGTADQDF